jgi:hypothetical protein
MDCNVEKNMEHCTCTYSCEKRGKCCECVLYHRRSGELPGCFFTPEYERTYDRSAANFIRMKKG